MGLMAELDLPRMIAGIMRISGAPAVGWAVHFFIGVVMFGVAMLLLDSHLPSESTTLHGVMIAAPPVGS